MQISLLFLVWFCALSAVAAEDSTSIADCYFPVEGGWQIRLTDDLGATRLEPGTQIGVVNTGASDYGQGHAFAGQTGKDNPRLHRRPLYPPAEKSLVWTEAERAKFPQCGFRPMVLAYNEPRFLFDFHSGGGLLGHLFIGLTTDDGTSKWFHQWSELRVRYENGSMAYTLKDSAFPGVAVEMEAIPLAHSVGLAVKLDVKGLEKPARITWAYGGASAFFTNYAMTAPEFSFKPEQCGKDRLILTKERFELHRAFDKSDSIMEQVFAAPRFIENWQAVIKGGSSWKAKAGFGDPNAFTASPAALSQATQWQANGEGEQRNCVAVSEAMITPQNAHGYILAGMGGDIDRAIQRPNAAWKEAQSRNQDIASRIVVRTPDPYLDAATPMMSFATEGTWGDSAVVHGGWSWRFAYLGWRTWYGLDCAGWTERIKKSIQDHISLGLIKSGPDAGAMSCLLDTPGGVFYNMNEVFLDHVRHYFDYTNDLDLMREIFPVLKGVVEWEGRRLQPGNEYLYESALNTWISDSHWYIQGQCTQASAYMLGAHRFLAGLARRLGEDPAPFQERAEKIRAAMQQKLWMPRDGVFAEYLDTRGEKLLHTQPELPTLYHSAEFGAADPFQIHQMLDWADGHLRTETTPNGGKQYWSSNWFPNNGRSYTHSTYEMAYAEELNFALTNYLGGRAENGYAILRSTLCGIFNGPTPGGLSCHAFADGRQRANDEFADASSMWERALTEGLFGIAPKLPDGYVQLTPQFPSDWSEAAVETPLFSYKWKRTEDKIEIEWEAPKPISVHLQLPARTCEVTSVSVDGKDHPFLVTPGIGLAWLNVETESKRGGVITCSHKPMTIPTVLEQRVKHGADYALRIPTAPILYLKDPGGFLEDLSVENGVARGRVGWTSGSTTLFAYVEMGDCKAWLPVHVSVESETPVPPPKVWSPPSVPDRDLTGWTLVDLRTTYNSTIAEALDKVAKEATPPPPGASTVGFDYWKSHLGPRHHGDPVQVPSDAAWRAKVGQDNVAWTTDGIPFATVKEGPNIGIVTQAGAFSKSLEFSVNASGKTLYLMLSGMTFPAQSHVANLRVTLTCENGDKESKDLVSPFDIGDCWSTWCGRWHDTAANGFENLGGRFGPAGSSQAKDLTQPINVDTEAHLVAFDLRPGAALKSVHIEAVANDVIFGVMGATVLR